MPFVHVIDYGYSPHPLAFVKVAVNQKERLVYLKKHIYGTHIDSDHILERLPNILESKKELILDDINWPDTRARIKKAGYNIKPATKPKIADSIEEIKTLQNNSR